MIWNDRFEPTATEIYSSGIVGSGIYLNYPVRDLPGEAPTEGNRSWGSQCLHLLRNTSTSGTMEHVLPSGYDRVYFAMDIMVGEIDVGVTSRVFSAGSTQYLGTDFLFNLTYQNPAGTPQLHLAVKNRDSSPVTETYAVEISGRYYVEVMWDNTTNTWEARINASGWRSGNLLGGAMTRQLKQFRFGNDTADLGNAEFWVDNFQMDANLYPSGVQWTEMMTMPQWWWEQKVGFTWP